MFYPQKGFWPRASFIAGLLLGLYFLLTTLLFLFNFITLAIQLAPTAPLGPPAYLRLFVFVVFYSLLTFLSYIVLSLFPSVRLTEAGLEYKSLIFVRRVAWDEMVDVLFARFPKGAQVLVFFRSSRSALVTVLDNAIRLYPNQTYGAISGVHEPVVIFSKGLQNREQIVAEIKRHLAEHGRRSQLSGDGMLEQIQKEQDRNRSSKP